MSWITTSCEEPAIRLTSSIVSLHVEQPALKTSIFFFVVMVFSQRSYWISSLRQLEQTVASFEVSRRGHVFQSEATTRSPIAPYTAGRESHANLPTRTPLAASPASRKGPYPQRSLALTSIAAKARTRNAMFSDSRYLTEIRKPRPIGIGWPARRTSQSGQDRYADARDCQDALPPPVAHASPGR